MRTSLQLDVGVGFDPVGGDRQTPVGGPLRVGCAFVSATVWERDERGLARTVLSAAACLLCVARAASRPVRRAIECDETTFGGARHGKRGWGAAGKVIVFGLVKRKNGVRFTYCRLADGPDGHSRSVESLLQSWL
jgi:hypothetical protein